MNRRDFMKRMLAAGLVLPATKTIFDMGANLHREITWSGYIDYVDWQYRRLIGCPTKIEMSAAEVLANYYTMGLAAVREPIVSFDVESPPLRSGDLLSIKWNAPSKMVIFSGE